MKRIIVVAVALAFVLLSAGAALAGIKDSKHDMRTHLNVTANSGYDEVCVYCHTPHSANQSAGQLWNHSNTAVVSYAVYTSSTMNATPSVLPGAGSLVCLSCHDGTVAVDSMVNSPNYPGGAVTSKNVALDGSKLIVSQGGKIGTDLTNDHPIGFAYPASGTQEAGLNDISTLSTISVRLVGGTQVECSSCHDAHNTVNMPFLRSSNAGSNLCLVCHNK